VPIPMLPPLVITILFVSRAAGLNSRLPPLFSAISHTVVPFFLKLNYAQPSIESINIYLLLDPAGTPPPF